MGGVMSKLPGWVQPYSPSHSIDWESVSMDHDSLLRFKDPQVAQEFTVYKQRDLIPTFIMMVFWTAADFFMLTRVVWVPWVLIPICLIPAHGNMVCLILDIITVSQQSQLRKLATTGSRQDVLLGEREMKELRLSNDARRATLANRRWALALTSLYLHCVEVEQPARWGTYDKHCRQAPDWFAWFGFRTNPTTYMSDTEISYYCSQSPSPFHADTSSFAWPVLPVLPAHLIPVYLLGFLLRGLAELYPRDIPWEFENVATDTSLQIFLMVLFASLQAIRHRTSMNQFIQEIDLRIATNRAGKKEEEVDTLLCSMLPFSALERLSSNQPVADYAEHATVLFSDVRGFTAWSSTRSAKEVVAMLNTVVLDIDVVAERRKIEKIKTIGDGYWAVSGIPDHCTDHAERMCNFGNAMLDIVASKNKLHPEWGGIGIRVGIHTGPLYGGILGTSQLSYEVFGGTSTIAGKVEVAGLSGHVVISEVTMAALDVPPEKWGEPYRTLEGEALQEAASTSANAVVQPTIHEIEKSTEEVEHSHQGGEEKIAAATVNPADSILHPSLHLYTIPRTLDVVKAYGFTLAYGSAPNTPDRSNSTPGSSIGGGHWRQSLKSWNEDLAKEKRAEFLARRAAAQMDESGGDISSETLEDVIARYSKRKYEYILCEFADPEVEAQFISNLAKQQSKLRIGCRLGVLGLLAIIMISVLTHSSRTTAGDGSYSLPAVFFIFPVATVLGIVDLASCFLMEKIFAPKVQAVLQVVTMLLLILGAGLMPPGSSYTTNDMTYLFIILLPLLGFGNSGLVSAVSLVGTLGLVFVPLILWLMWNAVMLTTDFFFLVTMLMMVLPFIVITERVYRIQFLQFHTAEYFKHKQEQRTREQEALLGSMVPEHIVKDLMAWMQTGMDPNKTIIQTLPVTATAFIQIDLKNREVERSANLASLDVSHQHPEHVGNPLGCPSSIVGGVEGGASSTAPNNMTSSSAVNSGSMNPELQFDLSEPQEDEALILSNHWLQDIHVRVDALLKPFASIVKIKTIGDIVMLAGPFTDKHSLTTSCDQMLAAICAIRGLAPLRAGLHCGELVGAVQGRSRLCFDIFGDTVNTASRVMTSGAIGDISVSEEFYTNHPGRQLDPHGTEVSGNRLEDDKDEVNEKVKESDGGSLRQDWLTRDAEFTAEPITVAAKGKGIISVRRFLSNPHQL